MAGPTIPVADSPPRAEPAQAPRKSRATDRSLPGGRLSAALAAPFGVWLVAFFLVPSGIMLMYSFWRVDLFQVVRESSLDNYRDVFTTPLYRQALVGSFILGAVTAAVSTTAAFALAWAVRFHTTRYRELLLILVVSASVGSYLARIYAWRSILGAEGLIDYSLSSIGLTDEPLSFLIFNRGAVIVALVNLFLPFAFLPIYASLLTIQPEVLKASRVLGAGRLTTFRKITLPLASTGLVISFLYVLIFATADFAAPSFLGGKQGVVAAQLIADQFGTTFNWPLGSALAVVYVLILGLLVGLLAWYAARRTRRIQS